MISKINLRDFRLFENKSLEVQNPLVILCGNNAAGKTSILEAIYLCSTTKSHRTSVLESMIKDGSPFSISEVIAERKYKVVLSKGNKSYFIDDREVKKAGEFIGNLSCVISSPLDLYLINGSKADRRRFLDLEISLFDKNYLNSASRYKKILHERNNLLKSTNVDMLLLNVLTDELISELNKIYKKRIEFIELLNNYLIDISRDLQIENIKLKYMPTYESDIKKSFKQREQMDLATRVTNIGAHRDDFKIYINDKPADEYASEGQARLICIAIKLSLTRYKAKLTKIVPILLLDDVFAALDGNRITSVTKYVKRAKQAFITTTSISDVPKELIKDALVLNI